MLWSTLGWKRAPLREVEAEIMTASEPADHIVTDVVDVTPAEQPVVAAEPEPFVSAVPEAVEDERSEEEAVARIPEPYEGAASPFLEGVPPVEESAVSAVPEPVDDLHPEKAPTEAEQAQAAPSPGTP